MSEETPLEPNPTSGGLPLPQEDHPEINEVEVQDDVHVDEDDEFGLDDDDLDNDEDDDDDSEEDFVESLPPILKTRVSKLKELNTQRDKIMDEYLKERAALEVKFATLCQPLYEQRRSVLNETNTNTNTNAKDGHGVEVDADTDTNADANAEAENTEPDPESNNNDNHQNENNNDIVQEEEAIVGIPNFWTTAMSNIETIEELITERDNECLSYLEDILCEDYANGLGFVLEFHFRQDEKNPNPFFTNAVLTKRYDVPNLLIDDEPILKNVVGCDIDWKDDMCLTYRTVCKKQRNKKGQIRHVKKKEKQESFFHFFCPPTIPNVADMDEEEADAIEEAFDHDYDVAQSFRKYIVPKGVLWFTGEAMEEELQGIYDNGQNLLTTPGMGSIDAAIMATAAGASAGADGTNGNSPFPPPVDGTEEPECKQN